MNKMVEPRASALCSACLGSGLVVDYVPYGDTSVPLNSSCNCVEPFRGLCDLEPIWQCPKCLHRCKGWIRKTITCESCGYSFLPTNHTPRVVILLLALLAEFVDGEYDEVDEDDYIQHILEVVEEA